MSNQHARRRAIANAIARRDRRNAEGTVSSTPVRTANAPQAVHLDLQSATMREGRTAGGQEYVSFREGGQPIVTGFGLIAQAMRRDRLAKGMAVRERGMLKIVALRSGDALLDERGDFWRQAA